MITNLKQDAKNIISITNKSIRDNGKEIREKEYIIKDLASDDQISEITSPSSGRTSSETSSPSSSTPISSKSDNEPYMNDVYQEGTRIISTKMPYYVRVALYKSKFNKSAGKRINIDIVPEPGYRALKRGGTFQYNSIVLPKRNRSDVIKRLNDPVKAPQCSKFANKMYDLDAEGVGTVSIRTNNAKWLRKRKIPKWACSMSVTDNSITVHLQLNNKQIDIPCDAVENSEYFLAMGEWYDPDYAEEDMKCTW